MRLAAIGAALLLVAASSASAQGAERSVRYAVRTLAGDTLRVGAGEPMLVAVFATWCRTCRAEFPLLDTLHAELARRGVRVVALSVDEGGDELVRRFAGRHAPRLTVARDASGAVSRTFGAVGVPETYLVDATGRVVWHRRGELPGGAAELRRAAARLAPTRRASTP